MFPPVKLIAPFLEFTSLKKKQIFQSYWLISLFECDNIQQKCLCLYKKICPWTQESNKDNSCCFLFFCV